MIIKYLIDYYNGWSKIFRTKCLFTFDPLENISDESKAMSLNQNFLLFSNMVSEMLLQFLFESCEIIFEKSKNSSLDKKFFRILLCLHYCDSKLKVGIFVDISACRSEATLQDAVLESFLSFDKTHQFSFFLNIHL